MKLKANRYRSLFSPSSDGDYNNKDSHDDDDGGDNGKQANRDDGYDDIHSAF